MIESIKKWLANHSISAKTVASTWLVVTGIYYSQPAFHDYVMSVYSALPKEIHAFIGGVVVPALIFWRTQKRLTVTTEVSPGQTATTAAVATSEPSAEVKAETLKTE